MAKKQGKVTSERIAKRNKATKKSPVKKPIVTKLIRESAKKPRLKGQKAGTVAGAIKKKALAKNPPTEQLSRAGEPVSPAAMRKFMDVVRKHLSRHCVLLACAPNDGKGFEKWDFATGTLLRLSGHKVIVTAGHWGDKVQSWRDAGALNEVYVTYSHVSDNLTSKKISPEDLSSGILSVADEFDAAMLVPSRELIADIEAQGNCFFMEEQMMQGPMTSPHLVMLCGYPVQGTIITKEPAFYSRVGGKTFQHDKVSLGSFAFQSTLLCSKDNEISVFGPGFDCDADEYALRPTLGKINSRPESGVTSAEGMSGGPVIAIEADPKDSDTFFKPKLFGIQSRQKSIERRDEVQITQLNVVGARRLLEWAKLALAQM